MRCRGAIFDMDGVLFDTERIYQDIWRELAAECHVELAEGFTQAITGTTSDLTNHVIEEYYHVPDGSFLAAECIRRARIRTAEDVPMKEGVQEILQFFREKEIPVAIASSSPLEQIAANLNKTGIRSYFKEIISGWEVKQGKPAPDIFLLAAKRLGLKPEECFVFEDSENGVKAGHAAGCVTMMIPDQVKASPKIRPYCHEICENLMEAKEKAAAYLAG